MAHSPAYQSSSEPASFHKSVSCSLLGSVGQSKPSPSKTLPHPQLSFCCQHLDSSKGLLNLLQMRGLLPLFSQFLVYSEVLSQRTCMVPFIHHWPGQQFRGERAANNRSYVLGKYPKSASLCSQERGKHSERSVDSIEKLHSQSIFLDGMFPLDAADHYQRNIA